MPTQVSYPGVYIEEIASGVHTITGVATSIAAFVDYFGRGPLNKAVQIFSMSDFERAFGGLDTNSEASYAISQFFLNGGSQAYVVRVSAGSPAAATMVVADTVGGPGVFRAQAGQQVNGTIATNPGLWGNSLRLEVDYDTSNPNEFFNLTVSEVDTSSGSLQVLKTETLRNLTMRPGAPSNVFEVVNDGSALIQLDRTVGMTAIPSPFPNSPPFLRPAATGTLGAELPIPPGAGIPADNATFTVDPGTGAVTCTINYGGSTPTDFPGLRPFVESAIRAAAPTNPLLAGASVLLVGKGTAAAAYRFIVEAGRGGPAFNPATTLTFAGATAALLGLTGAGSLTNVQQYSPTTTAATAAQTSGSAGVDGAAPDAAAIQGVQATKTGIYALEDVDLFNILCLPAAANLDASNLAAVVAEAENYCDVRRAFLIVDIPPTVNSLNGMQTWMSQNDGLRNANAAVYFPRPLMPDPLNNNRLRSVGASGTIAGLYAKTDANRGVWKAPAGVEATLTNIQDLGYNLTDPENGALNPLGINCLRRFPIYGNICWGARTLDGSDQQASDWKYVPVRRFALFLEESLYRGTKWVVFEPNDEPLWAQIRLNLGAFMHNLFRQGAFQGKTPREAYLVKCDSETTTQNDIDQGIVNILVGFAPLKPAEFVIIKIQQLAGQIDV